MSSNQAYFLDGYRRQFSARVKRVTPSHNPKNVAVVLEHSFFYPTSGGQPHDTGTLNGRPVVDVFLDKDRKSIVHLLNGSTSDIVEGHTAEGIIEWERRFDHMQQHTGQHILSQAFIEVAAAETVGFHLGSGSCTIDLATADLSGDNLAAAEALANQIVVENRPITSRFITEAEAAELPLRKRPDVSGDRLRVVDIHDFDLNACGGTHVRHTGEVGLIKISRVEKRKEKVRVEFRCGRWAIAHFDRLQRVVTQLTNAFTTSADALPDAMAKLREERKQLQKELRSVHKTLMADRAARLSRSFAHADDHNVAMLVRCVDPSINPDSLPQLAGELAGRPSRAIFLGHPDGRFVFRKSADVPGHFGQLLQTALTQEPLGSGGGGPHFAQGNLAGEAGGRMLSFLNGIAAELVSQIKGITPRI